MYRFYVSLKTLISFHQPEVLLFNFLQNFSVTVIGLNAISKI